MDIEFENTDQSLRVLEYVIREIEYDFEGEGPNKAPHFQARILTQDFDCSGNINCLISYYGVDSGFLGLDEQLIWTHDAEEGDPIPLSMPITIPEDAVRAVVRFNYSKSEEGFYHWAGRVATVLALMLLSSWVYQSLF